MEVAKSIFSIAFVLLAVILICRAYAPIVRDIFARKNKGCSTDIEQQLSILKNASESDKKAAAFVELISLSYVLVHTLVNKGNSYNDQIQSKKFRKSLTPETIAAIANLEGKYE